MADRVLVLGSGGREHALAWQLAHSPHVKQVLVAPGNAGTANSGKISNSAVLISNPTILAQFCKDHNIGLVIAGPEALLAAGIVDDLVAAGVRCFGPTAKAAQLGTNRSLANTFLDRHGIPTAKWRAFTNPQEACTFITSADFPALVVRPSSLGPQKEVILTSSTEESCKAVQEILQDNVFGNTGETVIIEELLTGEEVSCLCFVDGVTFATMPPIQVQKQLLDGDQGPSTVGMGAYGPVSQISEVLLEKIKGTLRHILVSMKKEGMSYAGVLQIDLILTKDSMKVISFSCHFGDPQCQVVLPLLKSDLYEVIRDTINGRLHDSTLVWADDCTAVSVVMASEGYPECYNEGREITGLLQAKELGLEVFHGATTIKDDKVMINGGRILTVTALKNDLTSALEAAYKGLAAIYFQGAVYRKDVGYQAMKFLRQSVSPSYKEKITDSIACSVLFQPPKLLTVSGSRSGSHKQQGGVPGLFDLRASGYSDPILVSQTKGIGTKLKVAQLCNKHDKVGQDLVAMCVNDLLCQGAEPLFLDYCICGKPDDGVAQTITEGIAEACKLAGCTILGRDTNEMAGMYSPGEYNLVGFAVGAVERGMKLPQEERIADGDVLIGIASSGLHTQGFSLVREIILTSSLHYFSPVSGGCGAQTLGEQLLTPSKIYSKVLLPVLRSGNVKAFIHVAEGGLLGRFPQILSEQFSIILDAHNWKIPDIFSWLQEVGGLSEREMAQMFNCGIGAVLVVQKELARNVLKDVQNHEDAWLIGKVIRNLAGCPQIEIKNLREVLQQNRSPFLQTVSDGGRLLWATGTKRKVKVAVLISGTEPASCAEVVLVIASRSGVEELKTASRAGIPTRVIDHKLYGSRSEYDGTIDSVLEEFSIELICLAGFVRVLSNNFLKKWNGKILSTYPSLSPLTKGSNVHRQTLPAADKATGCTVHFVLADPSLEAVIVQEPASVKAEDTEETVSQKVKEAEGRAFPVALQLVASGMVQLGADGKTCWKRESWLLIRQNERHGCSSSHTLQ
ncbi:PREDICTED: trifunctional purine biosynthetic protein adenosine-3-like [Gekko japonicus]|uniref:Trifunctional purine biosynthetic protein adenosine-3-like n=1 Tax=Gekko japonicus TaxID=146911 RepID=A0ABM1L382_GEKJA|nr:PREDICTED: trifunctional purine biosynthetic protein adenosine-3-like [Gekko japonicus]